jgi:hypothetical protein
VLPLPRSTRRAAFVLGLIAIAVPSAAPRAAQTDLDAFMRQVLARRDDNWTKLQQYVLDEREVIDLRGPGRLPMWGEARDYSWYIRDGYFIRSPVKANGVAIGEADRRKYEADYLKRLQEREKRRLERDAKDSAKAAPAPAPSPAASAAGGDDLAPTVDSILNRARQPEFISSAYFLRFKFEEGKYALVGREQLDGRDVLRIEYYPTKLYSDDQKRREARSHNPRDAEDAEIQRLLNKVALVTLWIEPKSHQIVKYTFSNIGFDFLPVQWAVHVDNFGVSMTMSQPFPDVWLPRSLELTAAMSLALGRFDLRYALDYHDYRQADVKARFRVGGDR